jgi:thymidylate synthase (FAD)
MSEQLNQTVGQYPEVIFRDDVSVKLIKASASDADVIWAARVSTAGEQSMDEIGEDPSRSAGLIN